MIRPIDRFAAALHRGEGDELLFQSGQPVRIRAGTGIRVLLAQPVRTDQIHSIFQEVVPAGAGPGFQTDGEFTFSCEVAGGPVTIRVRRANGQLEATMRAGVAAGRTPSAPSSSAPSPASAPASSTSAPGAAGAPPPSAARATPQPADGPPTSQPSPLAPPQTAGDVAVNGVAPGRKQIDPLLITLVQNKASDLHMTATMQVRMRKDGEIQLLPGYEAQRMASDAIRAMLLEIAPTSAREKFEETNDADYAYEIPGLARFRVNLFKDRKGVSAVLRVIPSKILTADELGLPQAVRDLCTLHKGLVVVTGPTGSGKSTTLAAMIDHINKTRSDHIITIEDPVEFVHDTQRCLVNQREVHADTKSFSAALRAALREDPDIVLVGEMRDLETISIAIETAETGHLVFGTLHTTTAPSTVDRIIDQFPTDRQAQIRVMLSESLRGVVAQTLCKKIGGGRVAALEILICNGAVANLIREAKTFQIPSMMQTQKAIGMQTLSDALFNLVKEGKVAPEAAYSKAIDRNGFKLMLDRAQIKLGEGH